MIVIHDDDDDLLLLLLLSFFPTTVYFLTITQQQKSVSPFFFRWFSKVSRLTNFHYFLFSLLFFNILKYLYLYTHTNIYISINVMCRWLQLTDHLSFGWPRNISQFDRFSKIVKTLVINICFCFCFFRLLGGYSSLGDPMQTGMGEMVPGSGSAAVVQQHHPHQQQHQEVVDSPFGVSVAFGDGEADYQNLDSVTNSHHQQHHHQQQHHHLHHQQHQHQQQQHQQQQHHQHQHHFIHHTDPSPDFYPQPAHNNQPQQQQPYSGNMKQQPYGRGKDS